MGKMAEMHGFAPIRWSRFAGLHRCGDACGGDCRVRTDAVMLAAEICGFAPMREMRMAENCGFAPMRVQSELLGLNRMRCRSADFTLCPVARGPFSTKPHLWQKRHPRYARAMPNTAKDPSCHISRRGRMAWGMDSITSSGVTQIEVDRKSVV